MIINEENDKFHYLYEELKDLRLDKNITCEYWLRYPSPYNKTKGLKIDIFFEGDKLGIECKSSLESIYGKNHTVLPQVKEYLKEILRIPHLFNNKEAKVIVWHPGECYLAILTDPTSEPIIVKEGSSINDVLPENLVSKIEDSDLKDYFNYVKHKSNFPEYYEYSIYDFIKNDISDTNEFSVSLDGYISGLFLDSKKNLLSRESGTEWTKSSLYKRRIMDEITYTCNSKKFIIPDTLDNKDSKMTERLRKLFKNKGLEVMEDIQENKSNIYLISNLPYEKKLASDILRNYIINPNFKKGISILPAGNYEDDLIPYIIPGETLSPPQRNIQMSVFEDAETRPMITKISPKRYNDGLPYKVKRYVLADKLNQKLVKRTLENHYMEDHTEWKMMSLSEALKEYGNNDENLKKLVLRSFYFPQRVYTHGVHRERGDDFLWNFYEKNEKIDNIENEIVKKSKGGYVVIYPEETAYLQKENYRNYYYSDGGVPEYRIQGSRNRSPIGLKTIQICNCNQSDGRPDMIYEGFMDWTSPHTFLEVLENAGYSSEEIKEFLSDTPKRYNLWKKNEENTLIEYGNSTKEDRKDKNQFFSDYIVANLLVDGIKDDIDNNGVLQDCTCGSGSLLLNAIKRKVIPPDKIYGLELDYNMYIIAKNRLTKVGVPENNIRHGNAKNPDCLNWDIEDYSYNQKEDKVYSKGKPYKSEFRFGGVSIKDSKKVI